MKQLKYAAVTHVGRVRKNNEDNFYVNKTWKEDKDIQEYKVTGTVRNGKLVASVCDGMGGEECGEIASLYAVETIYEMAKHHPNLFHEDLNAYVEVANEKICDYMCRIGKRVGTTFTVVEFYKDTVVAANIGDSRIYKYSNGETSQISTDHSIVAQMVRMGSITEEEARVHPKRHQITQHFGILPEEMILEPAVVESCPIEVGERYLLCSDGLTDLLTDDEIASDLARQDTVEAIVDALVAKALERGGKDNITVVVIEVEPSFIRKLHRQLAGREE